MAGVAEMPTNGLSSGGGLFSRFAVMQYAALASMRWSIFRNSVRSTQGAIELGARAVSTLVFCVMGFGLAFGLGAGAFHAVAHNHWTLFAVLMWAVFLIWQVVPITLASFQQQFEMAGLLRFPVSFGSFYSLHVIFGLIDASTIMGGFCCIGIWIGIVVARPELWGWAALALLVFAAFNVLLVRAIFAWIERWLAQRRTREIVSALFLVGILCLQFLNPALGVVKYVKPNSPQAQAARMKRQAEFGPWIDRALVAQSWLPPGLAARVLHGAAEENSAQGLPLLALLCAYMGGSGLALGFRLRAEFRGESLGEAPSRKQAQTRSGPWLLDGSGPIAAVMEKELRTLMRALPLLYALGAPLLMVFIFAGLFRRHGGSAHFEWGLLVCLGYAVLGFTQLLYNNLGTEGAGIQILFLSPTPFREVILAKNLFHSVLFTVDALLVTILADWRYGMPSTILFATTWAWVLFALPVHLAAGNLFSLWMPYRINLGRIGRQKGAQANALLSMLVQAGVLGAGALVFFACTYFGRLWLAIPILLLMAAGAGIGWLNVLSRIDTFAARQRESLIATLVRTE